MDDKTKDKRNNHHNQRQQRDMRGREENSGGAIEPISEEEKQQPIEALPPAVADEATPAAAQAVAIDDDEDYIATPEEIAAEARRSAERRARKHEGEKRETDREFGDFIPPDSLIDPYEEPDPTLPWPPYEESPMLSRGCHDCPKAYQPVGMCETRRCSKVTSTNWLAGVRQPGVAAFGIVEVRFKNNRKDFYRLPDGIDVTEGDVVAVEGMPGHDVGIVTLTGEVCRLQMKKRGLSPDSPDIRKLFRRAKPADIEKWCEAIEKEDAAISRTRTIADEMGLVMKIDDVEFQGDMSKATFYYTADDRVDFRNLIKVLADEFHVRVEMKQIGVRQEASRIGGLGTCGRELCCCTWLTNFKSVTTGAAKVQQIHPNPQKLAGQCGKLKCCLNFEADVYADALKKFPPAGQAIRFQKGLALYKKTDVFRGLMWYAYEGESELMAIKAEDVKKVIEMNRNQQYPEKLEDFQVQLMSTTGIEQEASNAEFESELQKLADSGRGTREGEATRRQPQGSDGSSRSDGRRQRGDDDRAARSARERGERRTSAAGSEQRAGRDNRRGDEGARRRQPQGERRQQQQPSEGHQPSGDGQQPAASRQRQPNANKHRGRGQRRGEGDNPAPSDKQQ